MCVSIRQFQKSDIPLKVRWINDSRNNQFLHYDFPLEEHRTEKWFQSIRNKTDRYDAVIEIDGTAVGIIGLLSIKDYRAEYYITIGEPEYKGKGIAKKASRELLSYAKNVLGLKVIYLYTEIENFNAQKLFESLGFERKHLERESVMNRGILKDRYYYEITL